MDTTYTVTTLGLIFVALGGAVIWQFINSFILKDSWSVWLALRRNLPDWLTWIALVAFLYSFINVLAWAIQAIMAPGSVRLAAWVILILFVSLFAFLIMLTWWIIRRVLRRYLTPAIIAGGAAASIRELWRRFRAGAGRTETREATTETTDGNSEL